MSYNYANQHAYYPQNGEHGNYAQSEDPLSNFDSTDSPGAPPSPTPIYSAAPHGYAPAPGYPFYDPYQQQYYQQPYGTGPGDDPYFAPQTSSSSEGYYDQGPPASIPRRAPAVYPQQRAPPQGAYMQARPQQPAAAPPPVAAPPRNKHGITLRPVSELPDIYRGLFKFGVFNAMQSKSYDTALHTDENMVIAGEFVNSSPTGSGKTVLFELAIVRLLMEGNSDAKCVYMAPTKALCSERFNDWTAKFQGLGISCCELTGDTHDTSKKAWAQAKKSSVIITTPEKWDSLTRNWSDNSVILAQMKLFLVDEASSVIPARSSLTFAGVPNIEDVANWIGDASFGDDGGSATVLKASIIAFGEEFRPCPIKRLVYGFPRKSGANDFQFNTTLDFKVFGILRDNVQQKPALVFCATRKGVLTTAEQIAKEYKALLQTKEQPPWPAPKNIDVSFHDKTLQDLARCGVGVHHAGIHVADRRHVEHLFTQKQLRVVVATSTLAVGVNFPAHTVVIKGTRQWSDKGWAEYSDLDIMQMIGRAGRPQFDKEGLAIIMTETSQEARYNALISGRTLLESSLHLNLTEHINSEIKLGTISNVESAKQWLKRSFLFQRIQKNPRHYSMGKDEKQTWEARLDELVDESVKKLETAELITVEDGDRRMTSTEYGEVMSRYYIRFNTLEVIANADERTDGKDIIQMLETLKIQQNIRFRPQRIAKVADKVFVMLQAVLGGINLNSAEYKTPDAQAPHMEANLMFKHAPKLARAVADIGIIKQNGHHIKYGMELSVFEFSNLCVATDYVQNAKPEREDLGGSTWRIKADRPDRREIEQTLEMARIRDIATLRKCPPQRLESLLSRNPPFGRDVMNSVRALPEYSLDIEEVSVEPSSGNRPVRAVLRIHVSGQCESTKKKKGKTDNFAGLTVTSEYKPALAPTQYPTMDTRPASANTVGPEEPQAVAVQQLDGGDEDTFWRGLDVVEDDDFLDLTGDDDQAKGKVLSNRFEYSTDLDCCQIRRRVRISSLRQRGLIPIRQRRVLDSRMAITGVTISVRTNGNVGIDAVKKSSNTPKIASWTSFSTFY
ncbi:P-loop containing nucleoside triphosphate hydrolase protein [Calocera cornea HHB12733]|uniref:DNA 3'-5' helicase n=1 Tax=Calocera cornea HHB12733 TaxID=1353952 RepID=A0A165DFV9_9BASI|nr:P-loop containing nucleoside triphosphate hydrolase protein [Calocera cornea HHB12733]